MEKAPTQWQHLVGYCRRGPAGAVAAIRLVHAEGADNKQHLPKPGGGACSCGLPASLRHSSTRLQAVAVQLHFKLLTAVTRQLPAACKARAALLTDQPNNEIEVPSGQCSQLAAFVALCNYDTISSLC